jgi:hypothetical protein
MYVDSVICGPPKNGADAAGGRVVVDDDADDVVVAGGGEGVTGAMRGLMVRESDTCQY